jgi:hypothetical protein
MSLALASPLPPPPPSFPPSQPFSVCVAVGGFPSLKGLSYEMDFENVDENWQILAFIRAAAGF